MKISIGGSCNECVSKGLSVFSNCSANEISRFFSEKKIIEYNNKEILLQQDSCFKGVMCIQQGIVKIIQTNKNKARFILRYAKQGELLGIDSFISGENYSSSAIAVDNIKVCLISSQDLTKIILLKPQITFDLMKILCENIATIEKRMKSIVPKNIKGRLAEIILLMRGSDDSLAQNTNISFSTTDLANLTGASKTYIYKILTDFSKHNLISIRNKKLRVIDKSGLYKIASENNYTHK